MARDLRTLPPARPRGRPITIEFEGQPLRAFEGEPIGVALFAEEIRLLARSPKFHRPRGLFCVEGHCASCLVRVDGAPNVRACTAPAREGLRCERQNAFPDPEVDLLRAADWLFPHGMDHHRLMTGTRIGNELFVKLVRQMGGTGLLPDEPAREVPPIEDVAVEVCVVGGGPAGLSAAAALVAARPGVRLLVVDEGATPGGSWLAEPGGASRGEALAAAIRAGGGELLLGATALAHYPEDDARAVADGPPGLLAVRAPAGLRRVTARRFLYATGAYDQNLPFPDNDRPGILSARACGRLAFHFGVQPGNTVHLLSDPAQPFGYGKTLCEGLDALGVPLVRHELPEVPAVSLKRDAIAVAAVPAPASELPRQHGAEVRFVRAGGGFAVSVDGRFATTARGIFAAGDVTGFRGSEAAARDGEAAGRALAADL